MCLLMTPFLLRLEKKMKHIMAASIEGLYIVPDFSELCKRRDTLSLDNYFESTCYYKRT